MLQGQRARHEKNHNGNEKRSGKAEKWPMSKKTCMCGIADVQAYNQGQL
jgi:hypothetical protein